MSQLSKGQTSTLRPDVRFAFVLSPDFTLTPFAGFIDAVRLSADERDGSRQIHCNWTCIVSDTTPVRARCGIEVMPWQSFDDPENYDYIVIVGGLIHSQNRHDPATYSYLKAATDKSVPVVDLCTGGFVMAEAGLMDGIRCAVHVDHRAELVERYTNVIPATNEVYVFDQGRITCPGGTALSTSPSRSSASIAGSAGGRRVSQPWSSTNIGAAIMSPVCRSTNSRPVATGLSRRACGCCVNPCASRCPLKNWPIG